MLKVKLLQYTKDAEKIAAAAARLCYSSADIDNVLEKLDEQAVEKFLNMLMDLGHESPIEHVTFTFGIEGVSRSLLAQLTRHRLASYSVKSQRYVKEGSFEYIIPPEIAENDEAKRVFIKAMEDDQKAYDTLSKILFDKHYKNFLEGGKGEKAAKNMAEKKAIEDARYVLPNACETKLIVTFNARSLLNFFRHRCCDRAQWEIREMANKMLFKVKEVAPTLFKKSGPGCVSGPCPEGKMTCGKVREMREFYGGLQ